MNQNKQRKIIIWDDIIMITLALVSAYLLVLEITTDLTAGGRIVGILLMICGIGMTGVFIALISSFLLGTRVPSHIL